MRETYGDYWDNTEQVRELCLNCKYKDCFGDDGCPERKKLIAKLKAIDDGWAFRNGTFSARGKVYEIGGEEKTLAEWCRAYGQKYGNVWTRMEAGMNLEEALTMRGKGRGGKRNRGVIVEIGGESHCISEWLRMCHMHRLTVVRYAQKHRCTIAEATKRLCAKRLEK